MTDRAELQKTMVAKLREQASFLKHNVAMWQLLARAADEIEHLRSERDLALANVDGVYARLMPEVERLRAALSLLRIAVDREGWPAGWNLIRKDVEAALAYQQQPASEQ